MKRIFVVLAVAALMAAMMAAVALPAFADPSGAFGGPGNSGAAHSSAFKNQGECVSSFAHGGSVDGGS